MSIRFSAACQRKYAKLYATEYHFFYLVKWKKKGLIFQNIISCKNIQQYLSVSNTIIISTFNKLLRGYYLSHDHLQYFCFMKCLWVGNIVSKGKCYFSFLSFPSLSIFAWFWFAQYIFAMYALWAIALLLLKWIAMAVILATLTAWSYDCNH